MRYADTTGLEKVLRTIRMRLFEFHRNDLEEKLEEMQDNTIYKITNYDIKRKENNMTQEELDNKIAELEKQIAELKQVKVKKGWKPKKINDLYWYYDLYNDIIDTEMWGNNVDDEYRYSIGDCFQSGAEAEEFGKKLTTQLKYKKYVKEHSEPIDWDDENQDKYYLTDSLYICRCYTSKEQGVVYASSPDIIMEAERYIGSENAKYLFEY